jgi:hypothetical protein
MKQQCCLFSMKLADYTHTHITMSSDEKRSTIYWNKAGQALLSPELQHVGIENIQQLPPVADAEPNATRIRQLFEQLIQVPKTTFPDTTIAIHPSAAFAVTLAARNILRRKEQEALHTSYRVVCLQDQFASAVYPWQDICKETSSEESNSRIRVRMDVVQRNDKEYDAWTRAILEKLGDSESDPILAVCLPPLHWSDGTLIDLKLIGSVCKQKKVPFIVDATQGEVQQWPCLSSLWSSCLTTQVSFFSPTHSRRSISHQCQKDSANHARLQRSQVAARASRNVS